MDLIAEVIIWIVGIVLGLAPRRWFGEHGIVDIAPAAAIVGTWQLGSAGSSFIACFCWLLILPRL
jgi:hypothetical protein